MTIDDFKFTKEDWYDTFTIPIEYGCRRNSYGKERGVRSEGGLICMLPKPRHCSGQDERYENELEENKANAKLIASAPKLLAALIEISEGKRRYNEDKLIHASNTIEDMIQLAREAINEAVS